MSALAWIVIHIGFPLSLFFLGLIMRIVASSGSISWEIFNASELAVCAILLSLFVSHSLVRNEILLPTNEKRDAIRVWVYIFWVIIFFMTAFFAAVHYTGQYSVTHEQSAAGTHKHIFESLVIVLTVITTFLAYRVQQHFRLETRIL